MSKRRILSYLLVAIVIVALITVTGWGLYKVWEKITPGYVYGKVYWVEAPKAYPIKAKVKLHHPEDLCEFPRPHCYYNSTYEMEVNSSDGSFRIDALPGKYKVCWGDTQIITDMRPYGKYPIYIEISPAKGIKMNLPVECYSILTMTDYITSTGVYSLDDLVSVRVPKQVIIGKKFFAACIQNNSVDASADLALVIEDDDGNEILRINDKVQEPNETYCIESYEVLSMKSWQNSLPKKVFMQELIQKLYYYVAPDECILVHAVFQILSIDEEPINLWEYLPIR